jgi:hypothetical protein
MNQGGNYIGCEIGFRMLIGIFMFVKFLKNIKYFKNYHIYAFICLDKHWMKLYS